MDGRIGLDRSEQCSREHQGVLPQAISGMNSKEIRTRPGEARGGGDLGKVTVTGKNRIMILGAKVVFLTSAALTLSGCTQDEATARLRSDLQLID